MAEAKGISLRYSFAPNLYISANETMMNSILSNLVTNAIKFSPVNSLVEISAYQEGKFVIFKIQDQGVGIHPDNLAKLFTSTFNKSTAGTLNESGVGLGLINSQSLVKLQGGDIWAESVVGAGSSFYFKIPTWE